MVSKKILGSGIAVAVLVSTVLGIAIYNQYVTIDDIIGEGTKKDRTVTDVLDRDVETPAADDIDKVVGLVASLRMILYFDAIDLIAGVEQYEISEDDDPASSRPYNLAFPELSDLPNIGGVSSDPELIVSVEPDVIFIAHRDAGECDSLQDQTGIPVIGLNYGNLYTDPQPFYDSLEVIGEVLGKEERADDLVDYFQNIITSLNNKTKDIEENDKPWLYIGGIAYRGGHGLTHTDCRYQSFGLINAKNTAYNNGTGVQAIDVEALFQWEEDEILDYLVIDASSLEGDEGALYDLNHDAAGLDCIDDHPEPHAVLVMPQNWYSTNPGTVLANSYYLGRRFFPEAFSDIDYTDGKIYNDIYKELFGKDEIYDELAEWYGYDGTNGFRNITMAEIDSYA
jgi:iron complex transport system substrate-binding protein